MIAEHGERSTCAQQSRDPRQSGCRVEEVKGLRGEDEIEGSFVVRPFLEAANDDSHVRKRGEVSPGDTREIGPALDASDVEPTLRKRERRLSRAAADLEHATAARYARQFDDVVDQLLRIAGTVAV